MHSEADHLQTLHHGSWWAVKMLQGLSEGHPELKQQLTVPPRKSADQHNILTVNR